MTNRVAIRRAATLLAALFVACAESPVSPTPADGLEAALPLAQPAPGEYEIDFQYVGNDLTLLAHVEAANGSAPAGGVVVFQYCSLGFPTNDINNPDEAPVSACEVDHTGHWVTITRVDLPSSGDISLFFSEVNIVTVIGFRIRYLSQGSGVANGGDTEDWFRPL